MEIVKSLAQLRSDYQILLGCRDVHKGELAAVAMGAPTNVNPIQLDITDDQSIDHCYKTIDQLFGKLDILINNAGTAGKDLQRAGQEPTSRQVWEHIYNTNVISTGVFTEHMIPLLEHSKSPRIIFMSSSLGSIGRVIQDGKSVRPNLVHYNSSKTAVNMMAVMYASRYPQMKVNSCDPGYRGTGLNDGPTTGDNDPALGAVNAVRLATEVDGPSATFSNTEGTLPW